VIRGTLDHWPVVLFKLSGSVSIEDVGTLARVSDEALRREGKHVNIFDCRGVSERPSALVRQKLAEYTAASGARSARFALGTVVIVESPILRSVMTAIHWVAKPTIPIQTVASFQEAIEACRGWLNNDRVYPSIEQWEKLKAAGTSST
jgi:hypothetical protein